MMKLGLVSAILPGDTFEQVIDYAAGVGFTCVEVCCRPKGKAVRRYAGITHIDLGACDEAKLLYYRDYARAKGVEISSFGYYPNSLDPDEEPRAWPSRTSTNSSTRPRSWGSTS